MQRIISAVGRATPMKLKRFLLGSRNDPSWFANTVHAILNRVPGERFPCLPCGGILKGYRMKLDWQQYRCFSYGTWEPDVVDALCEVVREGFVAFDVGAHIGYYALVLSRLVGPTGQVVSFEPLPSNFSVLAENIRLNNLSQAQAVNKAVLNRSCSLKISIPPDNPLPSGLTMLEEGGANAVDVEATSLDEFMQHRDCRLDFLKVDTEGAEELVLEGAQNVIRSNHPIIMVEIHHFDRQLGRSSVPARLKDWGYEIRQIDQANQTTHLLATWKSDPGRQEQAVRDSAPAHLRQ